jgi:DNA-binding beta-propeller fold protein YncE
MNNNVYVADDGSLKCIQKFDNNGNFLMKFGPDGTADGQFERPMGIVVNNQGEIYVVDSSNAVIQKFDANGNFILRWGEWGSNPNDPYQLEWVHDLAIDTFGNIYAFDVQGIKN